ncbi:acylphosphatase [Methanofollis aquaemaris]|uniref:Acylphosphatase n=1 Tax=Methanofollis aquaemaris TaxID=126734 RepID=A0A8A3S5H3_9EURY|nr:acylphosphatase [Methanofollis aquaemaris]QSZ67507.1 acylphosphatase [Methanofollis aquaemaris]
MKARVHVFVSGRVQGVFFRDATSEEAARHGVTGWVRNLADGRVEAVFEGEAEGVEAVLGFCRRGPPAARVTGVEAVGEEYTGAFAGFAVRR